MGIRFDERILNGHEVNRKVNASTTITITPVT